jgi:dihydrodipicolinate synthase/N-acetylneuraminate lyase
MTAPALPLHGVLPVFQTPLHLDESVDFKSLEGELEWIVNNGAHGLVLGMVSETLRLSDAERAAVVETAATVAKQHHKPLVVSVGAEAGSVAVSRAQHAEQAGASALMATPPITTEHSEEQIGAYFRGILDSCPLPLVVQDASAYVGKPLSIDLQARLFMEYGERVLFKPEAVPLTPTLVALREATHGRATVFEGMGGVALKENFHLGLSGTMPGAEVCWAVRALWEALNQGDIARAEQIQDPLERMINIQTDLDSFVACEKFLLREQGVIPNAQVRHPSSFELTAEIQEALLHLLIELQQVVRSEPVALAESS